MRIVVKASLVLSNQKLSILPTHLADVPVQPVAEVDVLVVQRDDVIGDQARHLGQRPPLHGLRGDGNGHLEKVSKRYRRNRTR